MSKGTVAEKLSAIGNNMARVYDTGFEKGHDQGFEEGKQFGDYAQGFEEGKQAEHNAFWDAFQQNGTRSNYSNAFVHGWDDTNFKPKYDIRPTKACSNMFTDSNIIDIAAVFENCGVVLDTSQCTDLRYAFTNMRNTKRIPTISAETVISLEGTFGWSKTETIDKLILRADGTNTFSDTFRDATQLINITIEGVIGQNIDLRWSTKLTEASIRGIITHLSDTASGKTLTLSKVAVDDAFVFFWDGGEVPGTAEDNPFWPQLRDSKPNWTITLV
jgi:hypothetical protein